jgi:transcription initiation factor IIE alpha subunit
MFEDDTIDIACPNCGRKRSILVREFEEAAESHFTCDGCGVGVKIEGDEFRQRLDQVRKELEQLKREAGKKAKRNPARPRKGDFQI